MWLKSEILSTHGRIILLVYSWDVTAVPLLTPTTWISRQVWLCRSHVPVQVQQVEHAAHSQVLHRSVLNVIQLIQDKQKLWVDDLRFVWFKLYWYESQMEECTPWMHQEKSYGSLKMHVNVHSEKGVMGNGKSHRLALIGTFKLPVCVNVCHHHSVYMLQRPSVMRRQQDIWAWCHRHNQSVVNGAPPSCNHTISLHESTVGSCCICIWLHFICCG